MKCFDISYYPQNCEWDADTGQWWNFVTDADPLKNKSIAITP